MFSLKIQNDHFMIIWRFSVSGTHYVDW